MTTKVVPDDIYKELREKEDKRKQELFGLAPYCRYHSVAYSSTGLAMGVDLCTDYSEKCKSCVHNAGKASYYKPKR